MEHLDHIIDSYLFNGNTVAIQYAKKARDAEALRVENLSKDQKNFFHQNYRVVYATEVCNELTDALDTPSYPSPSAFILDRMKWMYGTYILPRHWDAMLWAVDRCIAWPYTGGFFRPTIRSSHYRHHKVNIIRLIHDFRYCSALDFDLCDILEEKLPEEPLSYVRAQSMNHFSAWVACELDRGNERLADILEERILHGGYCDPHLIAGVVQSENHRLHKALGKLLLAARLQEGLRQAICEQADQGTTGAFMEIFSVIEQNNLIRYSSVRRAVGTWTGILTDETQKIDRVSDKLIPVLSSCLRDESVRKACLAGEDSMNIQLALISAGFYDVADAAKEIDELFAHGSIHQVLTVSYYSSSVQCFLRHPLARAALLRFPEDRQIAAAYAEDLMDRRFAAEMKPDKLPTYFQSREEALRLYDILMNLYRNMKKSSELFSPFIFPWHSAKLERGVIVYKLIQLSALLGDPDKLDLACELLPQCIAAGRSDCANLLLKNPTRPAQMKALCACLGDREESSRRVAWVIANQQPIEALDARMLEDLLRLKAGNVRVNAANLLMKQADEPLSDSIRRLFTDKKEEKRCAAYDLMLLALKNDARPGLKPLIAELCRHADPENARERILLDSVRELLGDANENPIDALFSEEDAYTPTVSIQPDDLAVYLRYFPDSELSGVSCAEDCCPSYLQAAEDIQAFLKMLDAHQEDVWHDKDGESSLLGYDLYDARVTRGLLNEHQAEYPFQSLWDTWYDQLGNSERILRIYIAGNADGNAPAVNRLYGAGFNEGKRNPSISRIQLNLLTAVCKRLMKKHLSQDDMAALARAAYTMMVNDFSDAEFAPRDVGKHPDPFLRPIYTHPQVFLFTPALTQFSAENFAVYVACAIRTREYNQRTLKARYGARVQQGIQYYGSEEDYIHAYSSTSRNHHDYLRAWFGGLISERALMHAFFTGGMLEKALSALTVAQFLRGRNEGLRDANELNAWALLGGDRHRTPSEEDIPFINAAAQLADKIIPLILDVELKRGDTNTPYTHAINGIDCLYGVSNLARILAALGKDTLVRDGNYNKPVTKREVLSHLLSVSAPAKDDDLTALRQAIDQYSIPTRRLIETAMYAPSWVDLIGEYLNAPGFASATYYFMAHMNERFSERRMARIAQFTPLSAEELHEGAFDVDWFHSAYEQMGDALFNQLYDAAKYISEGARHTRARKYADAALGRLDVAETEAQIADKRSRDLLMAYALIPLTGDDDLLRRYLFIQDFISQSRQFGAQRSASEKKAGQMALTNLAVNAHIEDLTRLTLRMEAQLMEDNRDLFEPHEVDDVMVWMQVDVSGSASILCEKGGKSTKSIPARLKKYPYILRIIEAKKAFTEQYRRTRRLFEEAMEEETTFTTAEINLLMTNPVARPVLESLVFGHAGQFGLMLSGHLTDAENHEITLKDTDELFVAHPVHLQQANVWTAWQRRLFTEQRVQPFKQVFRELYVKTAEEINRSSTLRYSGNQIQPAKAAACLKARRWIADPEMGLQKIYYRENVIVNLYAQADWFTPADAEAPTLEWVSFTHRETHEPVKIADLPDVLFSEVMRDVDLAVSAAHAGQVDPETSHSTAEMRAALLELTLPMLGFTNVRIVENRALIEGKLASYAVHLGSGVIHRLGGAMIAVLPVHSQHRGRIFLPFADDDPKTAEILSKVILFAEDHKIKDPSIREQLR